jgi:hypothetical protein
MFGQLTVYDSMSQILGRLFRVPVNSKPITVLELTGLPTEIVNVVVSVLCRLTFDFALWSEGKVPVTLVCEEAHRYVPANPNFGFDPCKRALAKIAKEGRKYGASLCIVTQRPTEIDPTILSQCNTVFALRMSNDRDQAIVSSAIADTGSGLLEFLPALGQREAIAFGDGVALPVRIKFDELPKAAMPRSSTALFTEKWQQSVGDENLLEMVVEKWRSSGTAGGDGNNLAAFAEAMGIQGQEPEPAPAPAREVAHAPAAGPRLAASNTADLQATATAAAGTSRRLDALLKRDPSGQPAAQPAGQRPATAAAHRRAPGAPAATQPAPTPAAAAAGGTFRSLRERLMSRS